MKGDAMKILVAGATGAVGKQLVPALVARGHDVVGMTRSPGHAEAVRALGATPAVADALDPDAVARVVAEAEPEVVIHQLTALSGTLDLRRFDESFAQTNRLRADGTDHLLAASRAVGVRRFVAQSYAGWPYARVGGPVKTEDDPLDPRPVPAMRATLDAIRHLEDAVVGADWTEGIVLRYGGLYGPETSLRADGGEHTEAIRRGRFPIVGDGAGVWSFTHVEDAAEAAVVAAERGRRGIYNIVDDEPARVSDWLPTLAAAFGGRRPWRVPRWIGRLAAGQAGVVMMTEVRGASNAKAKRDLGWQPRHASWREALAGGPAVTDREAGGEAEAKARRAA
jgi:nucleoside-diphosphate-sugar epimerase